jgi:hypothetical protein
LKIIGNWPYQSGYQFQKIFTTKNSDFSNLALVTCKTLFQVTKV